MLGIWKHITLPLPLLLWMMILGVSTLRLTITPDHLDGGVSGAVFRILCVSDQPLELCHFKWRDIYGNDGPLMDLSEGAGTPPATNYSYTGTGLDRGQCGISLNRPTGIQRWIVGCRVRSLDSGWHYAQMTLFAHLKSATSVNQSPRVVVVRPGDNTSLTCKSAEPLLGCRFRLPDGSSPSFPSGPQSPSAPSYRYLGSGLVNGACGIALTDVTESYNGFVWCRAWRAGYDEWRSFALVVASPPSVVLEVVSPQPAQGDLLKVVCTASNVLPTSNMTWILGGQIIRQDHVNEALTDAWLWPFQRRTVRQTLTRLLEAGDNGQTLVCSVKQVEDDRPGVQSTYIINYYRAPTVQLTVSSSNYREGDKLSASCSLAGGYPLANVTWLLGSDILPRSSVSLRNNILVETLDKKLVGDDNGKQVACVASHPSLVQPVQRTAIINVQHPPQISQRPREHLSFKVGSPGVAVVEFRANPRPSVYWTFHQVVVKEGYADATGLFEAAFLVNNVNDAGGWVAKLFINNVTLGDLSTVFFLNARNNLGEEFFRAVNFSTTEFADVEAQPTLTLSPPADYFTVGPPVTATCMVTRVRSVVSILWTLGNVTLTEGMSPPVLSETTQGKHTILQSVTLRLRQADDGNQLACIAGGRRTALNISVMYPPKKFTPVIDLYGFEVGKPGVVNVEIYANPQPTVKWEVGGVTIQGGEFDSSRRFHAAEALAKSRGVWLAKLFVTNISQEDIGSDFKMTASNRAGSTAYHVILSTSQPVEMTRSYDFTDFMSVSTEGSSTFREFATETEPDVSMSTVSSEPAESVVSGQMERRAADVPQRNDSSYRYLSIANTIAILILVLAATLVYIRLLRPLSQGNRPLNSDSAPIYMDNIYYDQMHGTGGQCNLTSNNQEGMGCE